MSEEILLIKFKGIEIPVTIKRFKQARGIKLLGNGGNIKVTTGSFLQKTKIKEILIPYHEKIYELYMLGLKQERQNTEKKDNLDLHAYFAGRPQDIHVESGKADSYFFSGKGQITIRIKDEVNYDNIYKQLDNLYLVLAKNYLPVYFDKLYSIFPYNIKPELRIKKMVRQWGNCKKVAPVITLNSHLIKLPLFLINYIIFHELAHLLQANHSKRFYDIIEERYPNRKEIDNELKLWSFVLRDNYIEEYPSEKSS